MPDKRLKELLRKYLDGTATPEESKVVDDWYDSLSDGNQQHRLSDPDRLRLRDQYWSGLKAKMDRPSGVQRRMWSAWTPLAAAVAGIIIVAYFFIPPFFSSDLSDRSSEVAKPSMIHENFANETDAVRHIRLSDGSTVVLFPESVMLVHFDFSTSERKVTLTGRAFFDISRDESRPFFVYANDVVTKVLGTSFTVSAYPDEPEITVAVTSGTVSVYAETERQQYASSQQVVLNPNQQAIYNKSDRSVSRGLVETPQIVIPEEEVKKMRFEGVAVSEIFKALEKMYGVDIQFDEKTFSKCSMTTSVSRGNLYEKIDVICEITGAQYVVEDAIIRVTGSGCN